MLAYNTFLASNFMYCEDIQSRTTHPARTERNVKRKKEKESEKKFMKERKDAERWREACEKKGSSGIKEEESKKKFRKERKGGCREKLVRRRDVARNVEKGE